MFEITQATRDKAPITAAFIGGSGAGKTYSALLFARGLVGPNGKIVVIDTEGGRSKIYADDPDIGGFFHLDLVEPYRSERFREAFKAAIQFGADAVVIDTISHEHEGFLEYAEQEEARISGRAASRNKWIKPKAGRKRFYSAISSSHAHVIATIRLNRIVNMDVKPAVEIMKPECDKDFPYRLDLSVEIQPNHETKIIKVPKPLVGIVSDGVMITKDHGAALSKNIAQQQEPNMDIIATIVRLETAADAGSENLQTAWKDEWKKAGPADVKAMTPQRTEMKKHLDRLKGLAKAADDLDAQGNNDPTDISDPKPATDGDGMFQGRDYDGR